MSKWQIKIHKIILDYCNGKITIEKATMAIYQVAKKVKP